MSLILTLKSFAKWSKCLQMRMFTNAQTYDRGAVVSNRCFDVDHHPLIFYVFTPRGEGRGTTAHMLILYSIFSAGPASRKPAVIQNSLRFVHTHGNAIEMSSNVYFQIF